VAELCAHARTQCQRQLLVLLKIHARPPYGRSGETNVKRQATSNALSKTFARPPRVVQVQDKTSKAHERYASERT